MDAESGWYPDSTRIGTERYWDGDGWTEQSRWPGTHPFTSPVPADLPEPGPVQEAPAPSYQPMLTGMPHESTVGFWLPPTDWLVPSGAEATPRRRGRTRRTAAKATSLVLAAVLVGGGSFLIFGRHSSADAAVAAAVNSSLANRTADLVISGSEGTPAARVTISGTGQIDFGHNAMQMTMNISGGAQQLTEQGVYLNDVAYVSIGNELGQILPGKTWVSLDLSQLTKGSASSSLGAGSLGNDPAAALRALSQGGNSATDLGPSTIDNVKVEGYEVQIDAAAIQKEVAQENLPAWLQQAMHNVSNPNVDYKVYIDGSGLLAALTVDTTETVSGQTANEDITLNFSDYGIPVNVTAPPADEVAPFQSFLSAAESSGTSTN